MQATQSCLPQSIVTMDHLRFDHSKQRWLLYPDHWWSSDVDSELMRLAKMAMSARLHNSSYISDDKRQEEAKWALQSESLPRLEAMVKQRARTASATAMTRNNFFMATSLESRCAGAVAGVI